MASPGLSEIITTTLNSRTGKLADNVTKQTALLSRLKEKGNVKPVSGGVSIYQEIEYAENSTFKRYSGAEALNISASDIATTAEFNWKQAAVAVVINGLELAQNSGKEQIINLLDARIGNAEKTMLNNLGSDAYSDGTAESSKQMGGLQLLVSDTGLGTVGNIVSNTYSWWQNQIYSFATNSLTPGTSTIQRAMNSLYLNLSRNTDKPDLIIADATYYTYYLESLQAIQRVTSSTMADAGFTSLKFLGADVVFDGGTFGLAPANHMYMLNTSYIFYRPHSQRNMVPLSPDRFSTNQDATIKLLGWMGNMTVSNRRLQGVIVS